SYVFPAGGFSGPGKGSGRGVWSSVMSLQAFLLKTSSPNGSISREVTSGGAQGWKNDHKEMLSFCGAEVPGTIAAVVWIVSAGASTPVLSTTRMLSSRIRGRLSDRRMAQGDPNAASSAHRRTARKGCQGVLAPHEFMD